MNKHLELSYLVSQHLESLHDAGVEFDSVLLKIQALIAEIQRAEERNWQDKFEEFLTIKGE